MTTTETNWPRIRAILAVAIIAGVPVVWSLQTTFDPYNLPKFALLLAGTSLLGAALLVDREWRSASWLCRPMLVPVLAILVPLTISWLASPYKEWALLGRHSRLQGLLPYALVAIFGLLVVEALGRSPRRIAWALLVAGGIAGFYSLIQTFGLDPLVYNGVFRHSSGLWPAHSTLGNVNFAGGFFAMVLPIGLALIRVDKHNRPGTVALTALVVVGLITSFSDGPWAAGFVAIAITGSAWVRRRIRWAPVAGWLTLVVIAVLAVGAVVTSPEAQSVADVNSHVARKWYWEQGLEMGLDSPLYGRGPNAFAVEGYQYASQESIELLWESADDPHSVPLAFFAAAGIPGIAGFVLFVGWGLWQGSRASRLRDDPLAAGFLGAVAAYALLSLVSLDEITLRVVMWATLAGLVGLIHCERGAEELSTTPDADPRPQRLVARWAVAGLLTIVGLWSAARFVIADHQMLRGEHLALDNDAEAAVAAFRDGMGFWDDYSYRQHAGRRIGELGVRRAPEGASYVAEMGEIFEYLDRFPDVRGLVWHARLLHAWDEKAGVDANEQSLALYQRARAFEPHNPVLAGETSLVLAALGREDEAISLLEGYLPRRPRSVRFWVILAYRYEDVGRYQDAMRTIEEGLRVVPDSESLLEVAEDLKADV